MNNKKDSILVVGGTGTVGRGIVETLKQQGYAVRAATSKSLDLVTGRGLKESFDGIDRAFFLSPPGHADQHKMLSPLIQEAKRRGLKKVVLMTAMGANAVETSPMRLAEKELEASGLRYNIIRPNWFLQNFQTFWIGGIREQAKIRLPAGRAKVSFIDAVDISRVAARLLVDDRLSNRDFDLTGPRAIDHDEAAKALSDVAGRKITYEEIAPETLKGGLLAAGLPADYVDFMLLIFGFLRDGYNARTTDSVREITGTAPRDVTTYAEANREAFRTPSSTPRRVA